MTACSLEESIACQLRYRYLNKGHCGFFCSGIHFYLMLSPYLFFFLLFVS